MEHGPLRIGILGAAGIARKKNWKAIQCSGNCIVAAVATRNLERTRRFIADVQAEAPFPDAPRAHDSYESLLADRTLEAVYLPLPTAIRKEWILRAAQAGKHVLSEKPCAVSTSDLREILSACERHGVQFMDGVMFDHNPRLARLRELLQPRGPVGSIRRITSDFSFLGTGDFHERNIRVHRNLEPLGCLGDLGWYCIRFSLWAMRWQWPHHVTGRILAAGADGVPTDFSGEMQFADNASAAFHCSFLSANQQWVEISGTSGSLRVADFVLPSSDCPNAWEINHRPVPKAESGLYLETATTDRAQESMMFRNFASQIRSGTLNREWVEFAMKTQQVAEACLASARADGQPVGLD